ncbi:hypothetical protein [Janthinobacterium fluminis]|uniref:Uncharacterized protein n=1 Tax=Janthinobacterium fluminis TaxID=2987524 RepID=A0ABT5K186_9BURK|nr:hypothetical protein [Janthinobacterium fluminis]MDC8758173.1 hypothetical protein [Janthinobacterium fluminis]
MPTIIKHRKVRIVMLEADEAIAGHCGAGDIAIVGDAAGWWTHFVGEGGALDSYDAPFPSREAALWAAKAAAEYGLD